MSNTQSSDSTQAMQSLLTAYADNEGDDEPVNDDIEQHPGANFISDDEEENRIKMHSVPANNVVTNILIDAGLKSETSSDSPTVRRLQLQNNETTHSATRLVSYMDDDQDDDDADLSDSNASAEDTSPPIIFGRPVTNSVTGVIRNGSSSVLNQVSSDATVEESTARSPHDTTDNEVHLPPEATGKCSKRLQEKVEKLFDKMQREGRDLNYEIQKRKDFRNPSIYEKIIEFCGIDEKGTNYPPELYHPDNWVLDENSFYEKLAQAQADLMQKKEREAKKSKVERQVGIKKTASEPSALAPKHP